MEFFCIVAPLLVFPVSGHFGWGMEVWIQLLPAVRNYELNRSQISDIGLTVDCAIRLCYHCSSSSRRLTQPHVRADYECKTVTTQENFDLAEFVKKRWYVHQQAVTKYVPVQRNYCSYAEYEIRDKKTFPWGYTVNVHNYAEDASGKEYGGPLCAAQDEKSGDPAKLKVAPCFLPQRLAGPYWVVAYDEARGYALVSGGQPKIKTGGGLCKNEQDSVKESGLWIFLRSRRRDQELIDEVRDIATGKGFDVRVLNDVRQSNCGAEKKEQSEL